MKQWDYVQSNKQKYIRPIFIGRKVISIMGMFTKSQKTLATGVYATYKKFIKEKDGFVHVVMFNSFSKLGNEVFTCEDKYTTQNDEILILMQKEGYEILDVKANTIRNQGTGLFGADMEGYTTLITYK